MCLDSRKTSWRPILAASCSNCRLGIHNSTPQNRPMPWSSRNNTILRHTGPRRTRHCFHRKSRQGKFETSLDWTWQRRRRIVGYQQAMTITGGGKDSRIGGTRRFKDALQPRWRRCEDKKRNGALQYGQLLLPSPCFFVGLHSIAAKVGICGALILVPPDHVADYCGHVFVRCLLVR